MSDIDRAPFEPTVNWRLQREYGNDTYILGSVVQQNMFYRSGVGGHSSIPSGELLAGPRGGKHQDEEQAGMAESLTKGAGNLAVGSAESMTIKAALVSAGVATGPAGWIAMGATTLLPKVF